jgi:hypothetical protein
MRIYLAKTLAGISMYGPIYDLGTGGPDKVEEYVMEFEEHDWLLDHLIDRINSHCDTLLDDGDVDFIGAEKCANLIELIESLPRGYVPDNCQNVVKILLDYANRAIEYGTGIEIEM